MLLKLGNEACSRPDILPNTLLEVSSFRIRSRSLVTSALECFCDVEGCFVVRARLSTTAELLPIALAAH